ncbi:endonuclease/exonuclease/phosphatase family protein [bacterium]|nr:endonuclease/exonuclease/phosphatase family protein [bacterium]
MIRKLIFTRTIATVLLIACSGPTVFAQVATLNVVSFNIRGAFFGTDPVDSWVWLNINNPSDYFAGPHRRDRAISIIRSAAPDIMGIQELKPGQRDDLLAAFPEYRYVGRGRDTTGNDDSNGIFFRASRFALLDQGEFWLSSTPTIPGTTFTGNGSDIGNPRMASWVKLRDQLSNDSYFVMSTHWSLDSLARRQSAELIQSFLPSLSAGLPILMIGDLNSSSSSTEYRTLRDLTTTTGVDLADAFVNGGGVDGRTFHNYAGGTSGTRIDHVLYTAGPNSPFTPTSASILRNTYNGGLYPSDHYPVQVRFNVAIPELSSGTLLGFSLGGVMGTRLFLLGIRARRRGRNNRG